MWSPTSRDGFEFSAQWTSDSALRLVFDTAALRFQPNSQDPGTWWKCSLIASCFFWA